MIEGFSNSATTQNFSAGTAVSNNSGQGAGTQPPAEVLTGFNWGAFCLSWIWGLGNKTFITLILLVTSFIPFVSFLNIFLVIWFGVKGNEWAWQNKRWESVEDFHRVQRIWAAWGISISVIAIAAGVIIGIALPSMIQS